jgi:hypothetical protein
MSDDNIQLILQRLDFSEQNTQLILQRLDLSDQNTQLILQRFDKLETDQVKLEKEWNEKFFQLSRDTLNFSRNIIVTAAVVAVVAPLLRESLTFALELIKQR